MVHGHQSDSLQLDGAVLCMCGACASACVNVKAPALDLATGSDRGPPFHYGTPMCARTRYVRTYTIIYVHMYNAGRCVHDGT